MPKRVTSAADTLKKRGEMPVADVRADGCKLAHENKNYESERERRTSQILIRERTLLRSVFVRSRKVQRCSKAAIRRKIVTERPAEAIKCQKQAKLREETPLNAWMHTRT